VSTVASGAARIEVTVVVPVCDPAAPLGALARALGRQGLADDAYELVLVVPPEAGDRADGLVDRVDRLAQRLPQAQLAYGDRDALPAAVAHGDWVLMHGEYGHLADGALRRLVDLGDRHGADVVLGAAAGPPTPPSPAVAVPYAAAPYAAPCVAVDGPAPGAYRRLGGPLARAAGDDLIDHVADLALVRRDLLRRRLLPVPCGPAAVARALLLAGEVTVAGGGACYHRGATRALGRDAAAPGLDALFGLLDAVESHAAPGPTRDRPRLALLRAVVDGATGAALPHYAEAERFQLLDDARRLVNNRLPPALDAGLPAASRSRAWLLREGRFADLADVARAAAAVRPMATLTGAAWRAGGLDLTVLARLAGADGAPLAFPTAGGRQLFPLPARVARAVPTAARDAAAELAAGTVEVLLHHRGTGERVALPTEVTIVRDRDGAGERISFTARARLGARATTHQRDDDWALTPRDWSVRVRVELCGLGYERDLPAPRRADGWRGDRLGRLTGRLTGRLAPAGTVAGRRVALRSAAGAVVVGVR
jgi:hypothetical protein